jgi:hypothetical protein
MSRLLTVPYTVRRQLSPFRPGIYQSGVGPGWDLLGLAPDQRSASSCRYL